jgi:hypothetical protein
MTTTELQNVHVKESDIPSIITSQFSELKALQESVTHAINKAQQAKKSADRAKRKSAGLFQKKEAIESLQSATMDLAESQISATEAQKVSFTYQEKLGEIAKYLFGLGVANLAANRSVVRELELQLKGASEEELSDLARQEIINVVKQLKAQEDMMKKQADLALKVKKHHQEIKNHETLHGDYELFISNQLQMNQEHDTFLIAHENKLDKQEKGLEENVSNVQKLQKDLGKQQNVIQLHTNELLTHEAILEDYKKRFKNNQEIFDSYKKQLQDQEGILKNHTEELQREKQQIIELNEVTIGNTNMLTTHYDLLDNHKENIDAIHSTQRTYQQLINEQKEELSSLLEMVEAADAKQKKTEEEIIQLKEELERVKRKKTDKIWTIAVFVVVCISYFAL